MHSWALTRKGVVNPPHRIPYSYHTRTSSTKFFSVQKSYWIVTQIENGEMHFWRLVASYFSPTYEDSKKWKKIQPFMKQTLRCYQRNASSFKDIYQLKTQSVSILYVWLFDFKKVMYVSFN